jgi:hypothetical protein
LWGIFVFGELRGSGSSTYLQVIGGSLLMMLGVGAIALSSAAGKEQAKWQDAARRESRRYNIAEDFVEARMQGQQVAGEIRPPRTIWDWILVAVATTIFVFFASMARAPRMAFHWGPAVLLVTATLALLLVCGTTLWRTTRFN